MHNPVSRPTAPVPTLPKSPIAQLPLDQQLLHVQRVLSSNTTLLSILQRVPELNIPNWYLAGGALSQTIWNCVSGLAPETGIRDYDLVYYNVSDVSWEAEDAVIQAGRELFADVAVEVEIRNQARVHLWYEEKHGIPCPPHTSVEAGIDTWISTSAMLGVRTEPGTDHWSVYAPRGVSDFFSLIVRPNPILGSRKVYEEKAQRWRAIWRDIVIEPWPCEARETGRILKED